MNGFFKHCAAAIVITICLPFTLAGPLELAKRQTDTDTITNSASVINTTPTSVPAGPSPTFVTVPLSESLFPNPNSRPSRTGRPTGTFTIPTETPTSSCGPVITVTVTADCPLPTTTTISPSGTETDTDTLTFTDPGATTSCTSSIPSIPSIPIPTPDPETTDSTTFDGPTFTVPVESSAPVPTSSSV